MRNNRLEWIGKFGKYIILRSRFNAFRQFFSGTMLKLMSIQTNPLQLEDNIELFIREIPAEVLESVNIRMK